MPCYDERDEPSFVRAEAQREWRHNSPVAELLCWSLVHMSEREQHRLLQMNPALAQWWAEHQERDKRKAARNGKAK